MRKHHRCLRIGVGIPMPRPGQTDRPGLLHGHDSLHDVHRSEGGDQRTDQTVHRADLRPKLAVPTTENLPEAGARASCSLISVLCDLNLVGLGRLERPTSRLSGVRSNQLSYRPRSVVSGQFPVVRKTHLTTDH
jgi:hypothetical protein